MEKIAVLIPCFNEAQTIEKVVKDWKLALPDASIFVYDNNSTDHTAQLAEAAGAVVRVEHCQGKGNVIRRMFREIDAQCYIMVDGDDTYPAQYGKEMADRVLNDNVDMVIGDRLSSTYFQENKRPFHNVGNSIVRFLINKIFHCNITDIMTGYRAFSFDFVKTFPVMSHGFEIETEMTIHAVDKNMFCENIVIAYRDRPAGSESKLNTYSDGIRVIFTIFNLLKDYKPLTFWGAVSLVEAVIALILFIPVFGSYVQSGLVLRFPTLIVCCFIFTAALLSLFTGLILHTMIAKDKQNFEFKRMLVHEIFKQKTMGNKRD